MAVRKYEQSFKEEAVKLATEVGVEQAAQNLGIPKGTLRTWKQNERKHGQVHFGSGKSKLLVQDPEKAALIKENKELQQANEILKEALRFFVVSQKK